MKEIKVKKACNINGTFYEENDILNIKDLDTIIRLNEKGFIYPLTNKDLKELSQKKIKQED